MMNQLFMADEFKELWGEPTIRTFLNKYCSRGYYFCEKQHDQNQVVEGRVCFAYLSTS